MKKSAFFCLAVVLALSACGVSVMDFLDSNTKGTARGTGFTVTGGEYVIDKAGNCTIAAGTDAVILVTLDNPRNLVLAAPVLNYGVPAQNITAAQSGPESIIVTIHNPQPGAYDLTLQLETADGSRFLELYSLPQKIECKTFYTISINPLITGGSITGTFPNLQNFGSVSAGTSQRVPEGTIISFTVKPSAELPEIESLEYIGAASDYIENINWGEKLNSRTPAIDAMVTVEFINSSSFADLAGLIDASPSGDTVYLKGNTYNVSEEIPINNKNITIIAEGTVQLIRTEANSGEYYVFSVDGSAGPASLTLKTEGAGELILDGNSSSTSVQKTHALIRVDNGGTLVLEEKVTLRNNDSSSGGTDNGGAVCVTNSSSFKMYAGAVIQGNKSQNGGGVVVMNTSTFEMYGGTIINNEATFFWGGGVSVNNGTFTMYGGEITGNSFSNPGPKGAGVALYAGVFIMRGGSITGNTNANTQGDLWIDTSKNPTYTHIGGTIDVTIP